MSGHPTRVSGSPSECSCCGHSVWVLSAALHTGLGIQYGAVLGFGGGVVSASTSVCTLGCGTHPLRSTRSLPYNRPQPAPSPKVSSSAAASECSHSKFVALCRAALAYQLRT
jgi:hypothetical protein